MRIVYFTHSLTSCWNHGNAHFQRGLLRELTQLGHCVTAYEPASGWSRQNLVADHGPGPLQQFSRQFPELTYGTYDGHAGVREMLEGADLVIVHEWTDPQAAAAIGSARKRGARFVLLFHDTHHRAVSDPGAMQQFDLSGYDGVLAFGRSLADVYERAGWGARAYVFHEAADTQLFKPPDGQTHARHGVVWVGNWGDDERSEEISAYLLRPARAAGLPVDIYGVRYPAAALQTLEDYGASYHGWIANADVPAAFARHLMAVHVPRRFYSAMLPGIPTIRVFEALACGMPLICAPWDDCEGLFRTGRDFLSAAGEAQMRDHMCAIVNDTALRQELSRNGLESIRARHTCAHRADQLLAIASELKPELAEAV
jgi:spore maturation protein CgeB